MGMPAPTPITTIEELLALPEDGMRHELLDGEHVMTPTPRRLHQRIVQALYEVVKQDVNRSPGIELFCVGGDIQLGPRTLVVPDLFIVPRDNTEWADTPVPILAVEVLSPSTAKRDRGIKRELYLEAGVEEYWVVDIDARLVERRRPGDTRPEIIHDRLAWSLSAGAHGSVDLPAVFGPE